jgi:hypothetical protein
MKGCKWVSLYPGVIIKGIFLSPITACPPEPAVVWLREGSL